jgi:hypothetical protein
LYCVWQLCYHPTTSLISSQQVATIIFLGGNFFAFFQQKLAKVWIFDITKLKTENPNYNSPNNMWLTFQAIGMIISWTTDYIGQNKGVLKKNKNCIFLPIIPMFVQMPHQICLHFSDCMSSRKMWKMNWIVRKSYLGSCEFMLLTREWKHN